MGTRRDQAMISNFCLSFTLGRDMHSSARTGVDLWSLKGVWVSGRQGQGQGLGPDTSYQGKSAV